MFHTFTSPDISCEGCANAIKSALSKNPAVKSVRVDVSAKNVQIDSDLPRDQLIALLTQIGFPPKS